MHKSSASQDIPAKAEVLARVYMDAIAGSEGVKIHPMFNLHDQDAVDEFLKGLETQDDANLPHIRVDLLIAAALSARMIAAETDLAHRLRNQGPVVLVKTHTSELVDALKEVFEACATNAGAIRKLIVARDGTERGSGSGRTDKDVLSALKAQWPVIGIAPSPKKQLPAPLLRMAQYELSLPPIDRWDIELVLQAITGKKPEGVIDSDIVRDADITDYALAFHRGYSAEQCLERLGELVTKKRVVDQDGPLLEDLAGYSEAKVWGLELVADIAAYRKGEVSWDDFDHRGLLLSGPPGVGKSSFAKALARSAGVPLIATSVANWNAASYLSGTLQSISDVFGKAQRLAPSILFIDEVDGISDRSALRGEYVEYWTQIVNLVLEHLAGVDERPGVTVIAATNHPEKIDPALLRSGRLDRHISLQKPDVTAMAAILRFHLGANVLPDADLMSIALAARGSTGADCEAWVRRAKADARRAGRDVTVDDLINQVTANNTMTPTLRRRISIHEAGHVVAGHVLGVGKLQEVGIGHNAGFTLVQGLVPAGGCERDMDNAVSFFLAGRAAEKILLGDVGTGSGGNPESDLANATTIALQADAQFGFGALGLQYVPDAQVAYGWVAPQLSVSVRKRLDLGLQKAEEILGQNLHLLKTLADALDRHGYLSAAEVADVIDEAKQASVVALKDAAE